MIKTALVAMTIVGCDCDAKLCEYIGETPARWATVADCEAAMKTQMLHEKNFDYPLISGVCRTVQPSPSQAVAEARADAPAAPLPADLDHRPSAPVGPRASDSTATPGLYEAVLDGGRTVLYRTENGYALVKGGIGSSATGAFAAVRRSAGWLAAKVPAL